MGGLIPFCVTALILTVEVYARQCGDCMDINLCPAAVDLARSNNTVETVKKLINASCGFDYSGRQPVAKVCCSMFRISNRRGDKDEQDNLTAEDTLIANHPNLKLLPENCGFFQRDRVVGGTTADLYEFPWMALIAYSTRDGKIYKCGGSIINKRYVLTAAHCVKDKILADVRVGEYDLSEPLDCQLGKCEAHIQELAINRTIIHEKYRGSPKLINDIALLRLDNDIDFAQMNVQPICLPVMSKHRKVSLSGKTATVSGWGLTETGRQPSIIRKVEIPIYSAERCSELYNRFSRHNELDVTSNFLCAGDLNKDSCEGDSGGPLILDQLYNNNFRFIQYGIVSYGPRQCGTKYPGLYTDVTKFMGWILDNINP